LRPSAVGRHLVRERPLDERDVVAVVLEERGDRSADLDLPTWVSEEVADVASPGETDVDDRDQIRDARGGCLVDGVPDARPCVDATDRLDVDPIHIAALATPADDLGRELRRATVAAALDHEAVL